MSASDEKMGVDLHEGYADIGDVRLHYMEAGEGPLIILLHGFPEFWFGWRLQIEPLAAAGFRCNVQESGVSCQSDTSGKGFTFSADGFVPQYTDLAGGAR